METNSFPHNAFGSVHCWPCFSSTWTRLSLAVLDLKHKWKNFKFLLGPISWFPLGLYLFSFYSLPDFFQIVSMMCSHHWVNAWHYVWVCFCLSVYVCLSYIICVTFFGSFGKPGLWAGTSSRSYCVALSQPSWPCLSVVTFQAWELWGFSIVQKEASQESGCGSLISCYRSKSGTLSNSLLLLFLAQWAFSDIQRGLPSCGVAQRGILACSGSWTSTPREANTCRAYSLHIVPGVGKRVQGIPCLNLLFRHL